MISFRKRSALVIKEMAAYTSSKSINEISVEDFENVLSTGCRQTLSFNIFQIIFQIQSVDIKRLDVINTWIARRTPLLSVAFPGSCFGKIRERPSIYVYPQYNIMQCNWPYLTEHFNPSQTVLDELKLIVDIVSENNITLTCRKRRAEMRCNSEDDLAPALQAMRESNTEEIIQLIPRAISDEPVTRNNCPIIYTEGSTEEIIEPLAGTSLDEPFTCYRSYCFYRRTKVRYTS